MTSACDTMTARTRRAAVLCVALGVCLAAGTGVLIGAAGCATRMVGTSTADDVLARRVETALVSASDVNEGRMTIHASRGVVTLTGQVASGAEQQSVGAIVRAIPGVEDVLFALTIAPSESGENP